jgi:hypothetical protein
MPSAAIPPTRTKCDGPCVEKSRIGARYDGKSVAPTYAADAVPQSLDATGHAAATGPIA